MWPAVTSEAVTTGRWFAATGDELGAVGASTVTAKTADAALVPFASAVAVKLCAPTVSPLSGKLQAPLAFTEAWPTDVVPSNTLTVLLASPVPVNVIEVAVVWPSPTGAVSEENEAMTGAAVGVGGGGGGAEPVACTTDTSSNCHAEGSCRKSNSRGVLVLVAVKVKS